MNRKLYLIGTLAMVLLFASCKKEKETENNSFVISASIENDGSKTHVEGPFNPDAQHQNKYYKVKWDNNDKIIVFDQNGPGKNGVVFSCDAPDAEDAQWANFTCESSESIADNGSYWAFYPSATQGNDKVHLNEIVKNSNAFKFYMPSTQTYASGTFANNSFPMAAIYPSGSKSSVKLKFKHAFGVLKINAKGKAKITAIRVTDNDGNPLWGDFEFNLNTETTSAYGDGYPNDHILTLNLGSSGVQLSEQGNGTDFYIVLPPGTLQNFMVEFLDGSPNPVKSFTVSNDASTISRKTVTPATVTGVNQTFKFKVGDNKFVEFSPGNLLYRNSRFYFEEKQYYYHTYDVNNYNNNRGFFQWSTNNAKGGILKNEDYNYDTHAVKSQEGFYDWGNFDIYYSDGHHDEAGTWRTLTSAEMAFLITKNTHAGVEVEGVFGHLFLPYGSPYNVHDGDEYDIEDIEAMGAAFWPAAGCNNPWDNHPHLTWEGQACWYWGATHTPVTSAYTLYYNPSGEHNYWDCYSGAGQGLCLSVRLVKDVPNN